jgi:hypothetical protein
LPAGEWPFLSEARFATLIRPHCVFLFKTRADIINL